MAIFHLLWLCLALPSWTALESKLPSVLPPVYHETLPDSSVAKEKPILYRDKDALCPYSQQVWLALEAKGVDYVTVLSSSPMKLMWPDGTVQSESLEILERIEKEYPDKLPNLYPKISEAVDSVRCNIVRFKGVFPRNTNPTPLAPFLFRSNGDLVPSKDHMVTLEETEEMLEEYYTGPFLCGKDFTAADIAWAPFLERYAVQLPCMNPGAPELDPRSKEYSALKEWYEAMEALVPCYSSRVEGSAPFWRSALETAVEQHNQEHDDNVVLSATNPTFPKHEFDAQAVWKRYAQGKPWLGATPEEECAVYMTRNRDNLISDATAAMSLEEDEVDIALREVIAALLNDKVKLSGNAREVAAFVNERIAVPRDMGMLPAATLARLVAVAPAPRIA